MFTAKAAQTVLYAVILQFNGEQKAMIQPDEF